MKILMTCCVLLMQIGIIWGQDKLPELRYNSLDEQGMSGWTTFKLHDSGLFEYVFNGRPTCGVGHFDPLLFKGHWQETDEAMIFNINHGSTELIKEVQYEQQEVNDELLTFQLIYDNGNPVAGRQVRFYDAETNDFTVWYTDENGEIEVQRGQFKSIDLLGFHWKLKELEEIPIDEGSSEMKVVLHQSYLQYYKVRKYGLPKTLIFEKEGTCKLTLDRAIGGKYDFSSFFWQFNKSAEECWDDDRL